MDVTQAVSVEQTLRTETFHIEMALEMAGMSGTVANCLAQKNNQPAGNGVIAAMDPALMSMPASQVKQVLDSAVSSQEQKIEALFAKLAKSLQGNPAPDKPILLRTLAEIATGVVKDAQVQGPDTTAQQDTIEQVNKPLANGPVHDSKVLRMLLKIDQVDSTNTDAANQAGKVDLARTLKAVFAKDPADLAQTVGDKPGAGVTGGAGANNGVVSPTGVADARSITIGRHIEESVMNQVADKLHTALKTGVTEIRLLLRPESLGEMRVKLTMDGNIVMGKIYVENQQVKQIVESNLQILKDAFAQHNLQAGAFDVNVGGGAREQMQDLAWTSTRRAPEPQSAVQGISDGLEPGADGSIGMETGRRFGSNTIEYFA